MAGRTAAPTSALVRRYGAIVAGVVAMASFAAVARAEPETDGSAELAGLLASAREYEIRAVKSDAVLEFREPSLLNFTNPERNQERGSVFVWMRNDRPEVIG